MGLGLLHQGCRQLGCPCSAMHTVSQALPPAANTALPPPPKRRHFRNLRGNVLVGTLPASWAAAPSLQVLLLDDNRLNGSLPAVGLPAGAREVGLKGNALEGTLPAAIVAAAPSLRQAAGAATRAVAGSPAQPRPCRPFVWKGFLWASSVPNPQIQCVWSLGTAIPHTHACQPQTPQFHQLPGFAGQPADVRRAARAAPRRTVKTAHLTDGAGRALPGEGRSAAPHRGGCRG